MFEVFLRKKGIEEFAKENISSKKVFTELFVIIGIIH